MSLAEWKKMRSTWTEARDRLKVSKGAVKGISMGDLIEKVTKASQIGFVPTVAATDMLITKIAAYRTAIKTQKNGPSLVNWIGSMLDPKTHGLKEYCTGSIKTLKEFKATLGKCPTTFGALPDDSYWADAEVRAKKNSMHWTAEAKEGLAKFTAYHTNLDALATAMEDFAPRIGETIPGKPPLADLTKKAGEQFKSWALTFRSLCNSYDSASLQKTKAKFANGYPTPQVIGAMTQAVVAAIDAQGIA